MAASIALIALCCTLVFIGGVIQYITLGLILRYLRMKLGSRDRPSPSKAIVITGGTSGIGLALAKIFYRKGFTVFATYYDKQNPGRGYDELRNMSKQDGTEPSISPKLFLIHMDVRSEQSINVAADEIELLLAKHQIQLHTVICCAGILDCFFEINSMKNIHNVIETNFVGTTLVAKRFTLPIIKSKGRILLVSSSMHRWVAYFAPVYIATKAAVASFAESLDETLKQYGASCRCVCPGNLSNMTNLMLKNDKYLQDSVASLSPEEKVIYKNAIAGNSSCVDTALRFRFHRSKEDGMLSDHSKMRLSDRQVYWFKKFAWLQTSFDGSVSSFATKKKMELENFDSLDAFKNAVLMRNPPDRLYAGNRLFQHVIGPIIGEYPPPRCLIRLLWRSCERASNMN